MVSKIATLAAAVIVAVLGVLLYFPTLGNLPSGTTTTSTASTSCTTKSISTQSATSIVGTFAASSAFPVRVESVNASITTLATGTRTLQFEVEFRNVGSADIYVERGCGSSLNSTISSGGSVVQTFPSSARCLCAVGLSRVSTNQSLVAVDPGCWSGYYYEVRQSGTFSAKLVLSWGSTPQFNAESGSVTINAKFTIP